MAFIREYMQAGDPRFRFRAPRFIRKFQPGKALRSAVRYAAPFIPGPVGALASFAGDDLDPDLAWMGDPKSKRAKNKRKAAGAGPKAKQKAKNVRRGKGPSATDLIKQGIGFVREHAGTIGTVAGGLIGAAGGPAGIAAGAGLGGQLGGAVEDAGELVPVAGGRPSTGMTVSSGAMLPAAPRARGLRAPRVPHMAQRHVDAWTVRPGHMNPTNVKALRRGVRRIEAFERVVKSVHKAYPRLAAASRSHASSGGHKAGCKCFRCRRG